MWREDLGLPDLEDVRQGVVACKIAAHAADVARGFAAAVEKDRKLSAARAALDWKEHLDSAIDPKTARMMYEEACAHSRIDKENTRDDYCTMCGKAWCSVRINKELKEIKSKK